MGVAESRFSGPVLASLAEATPERLTAMLRESTGSDQLIVTSVSAESRDGAWSRAGRLTVGYGSGAESPGLPRIFWLKLSPPDSPFGASEVDYYRRDYASIPNAPLPRSYHAVYDPEQRRYHLLLEDCSQSHRSGFQVAPDRPFAVQLGAAFARLHAPYWRPEQRLAIGAAEAGDAAIDRYVAAAEPGIEPMLHAVRDDVPAAHVARARAIFAQMPGLMKERARVSSGQSLVHGDPNSGNILVPVTEPGQVLLIDRQPFDWSLTTWLGASDLSYLMVLWWSRRARQALQVLTLMTWLEELERSGIEGYGWRAGLDDYRLTALQGMYVAAEWCSNPADVTRMRWVWFREFRRTMDAFDDLRLGDFVVL